MNKISNTLNYSKKAVRYKFQNRYRSGIFSFTVITFEYKQKQS